MSTETTQITEGSHVEVQYDPDSAFDDGEIQGRVTDVDTDPDATGVDRVITIDEGEPNQEIHYAEGVWEGEPYANVNRYDEFSGDFYLGDNATIRKLT